MVEAGKADALVVQSIYDAFARRDIDGLLEHVAPDATFVLEGTARLLHRTEPYRGHDGVREYFADVDRVWDELRLQTDDVRALAGSVIVFGTAEGRVDGQPLRRRVAWTWRLRDGLVVGMRAAELGED